MHAVYIDSPALVLAGLTCLSAFAWWVMARRPGRWSGWVDRENDFWVRKGWSQPATAERIKKLEKGPIPKMLAAAATGLGTLGLILWLIALTRIILIEHQKLRLPYNPGLIQKPVLPSPSPKTPAQPPVKIPSTNRPAKPR